MLAKMGVDFQAENVEMRGPLFQARKVILGTMMQSKHAMLSCNRADARDPAIYHPIHPGEPTNCSLIGHRYTFQANRDATPIVAPFLSAVLCDKPPTSEVLSCLEVRLICGRLQDLRRCGQTFSLGPTKEFTRPCLSFRPCASPYRILAAIQVYAQWWFYTIFLVARASPYRVTKK
jgi:hypothetical protein